MDNDNVDFTNMSVDIVAIAEAHNVQVDNNIDYNNNN